VFAKINNKGTVLSLKEQIDMVKDELNQEEKMFEGAVKAERFFAKYKIQIISFAAAAVLVVGANIGYSSYENSKVLSANIALNKLLNGDASDKKTLDELKSNSEKLYELYTFSKALKNSDSKTLKSLSASKEAIISDVASYQEAVIEGTAGAFNNYSYKPSAIMKDLAVLNEAIILMKSGDLKQGRARLDMISVDSSAANFSTLLRHYGLTKE